MDQKIAKPKSKLTTGQIFRISLLSVLLLGLVGYGFWYYHTMNTKITEKREEAQKLESDTAVVERGDLTNTLDDIRGTVRSNQSVYLYWQISGTVDQVNVEVGDEVKKGDILATLDRSTIDSSIIEAQVTKEQAEESLERLYTSTLSLEQARSKMVQAKQAVEDAQEAYDALGVVREDELEIGVKYDDYQNAVSAYEQAQAQFEEVKDLDLDNPDRTRAQSMLESSKSRMDSAKAEYNWYNGETDELEVQQAEAALMLAQAQLDDAERAYNRIKDGPTENQVNSLQAQIDAAQATINTSMIVSPIDGTVADVDAKPYDVITYESTATTRDILAVRVDDLTSHYIDITVSELNINKISLGQEVKITFDAIPLREYTGTIVNISNAGTVTNLSVNYALTVKMDEADDSIKSGMMADVEIVTESVEDVLYVPQKALSVDPASGKYIVKKVEADGTVREIQVETGLSSGSDIQIISDQISEGDTVQLTKVTDMLNNNNSLFGISLDGGAMGGAMGGGGAPGGGNPGGGGAPGGGGPGGGGPR